MEIEFPITVKNVEYDDTPIYSNRGRHVGKYVAVRPVSDNEENQTFLGLHVGRIAAFSQGVSYNRETETLKLLNGCDNPAIFIFDLNKIVFGYESWWSPITSPEDLQQITNAGIENIWYVKALRELSQPDNNALAADAKSVRG